MRIGDIPLSYAAITNEWLTKVICHGGALGRVRAHRLGPEDNGSWNRRSIEIDYDDASPGADQ